jgi:SGNH domain (fused to AT3 domains)
MPPALASQMSWLGLGLIGLSAFIYNSTTVYPGSAVVLPVVGSALVIAGGCPGWPRSGEFLLKRRPMQFLGRTSYSWYLVHWPVLVIVPLALGHGLTTANRWTVLFGSLAIAVAMYYVIEQPVRIRPSLISNPRYSLALGCTLILVSIGTAKITFDNVTIPGSGGPAGHSVNARNLAIVEKAVAAGAKLTDLPRNVTPPLTKAATDRPFTTSRCLVPEQVTVPAPLSKCTFGDRNGKKTMAVIGDSHANQWAPAFEAFGKADHWKVILFSKAACTPGIYPTYVDPLTNRLYTQCNVWRNRVIARVGRLKPNVVVIASELRTIDVNPAGMVTSIKDYEKSGARVIYLEDTPSPQEILSVPDCLAKNPSHIQQCGMLRKAATTRLEGFVQRRIESTAAKQAGAGLIDPTPWFCTATICPPIINNMIVYQDASHITATYARWLAPVMSAALKHATHDINARQPAHPGGKHRHAHPHRKHRAGHVARKHKHRPGHLHKHKTVHIRKQRPVHAKQG